MCSQFHVVLASVSDIKSNEGFIPTLLLLKTSDLRPSLYLFYKLLCKIQYEYVFQFDLFNLNKSKLKSVLQLQYHIAAFEMA